ncbi:hypothetical protein [Microbacterium sp. No. 7]|uniref:hypothetical protein n=1 Tax=Microbacterium sp. No. 7 TaxID=1714373 RepID=UPI0006D2C50F|nr:hypothetical protein [Microbacterium sp. No. 7]ALJ19552.1 hypothetical protein AOA12_06365 [Microbacterium sp. No. 7]
MTSREDLIEEAAERIAQRVAGTSYVAGRTLTEHTRRIAFDVAKEAATLALCEQAQAPADIDREALIRLLGSLGMGYGLHAGMRTNVIAEWADAILAALGQTNDTAGEETA